MVGKQELQLRSNCVTGVTCFHKISLSLYKSKLKRQQVTDLTNSFIKSIISNETEKHQRTYKKRNGLTFGIQTTAVDVQCAACSLRCYSYIMVS